MRLAFLTLTPRAKSFLCKCAVTALSKQARSVTLALEIIQHAVIHRLANSELGPCATRVVPLVVQVAASLRQKRRYAGSLEMIGVIRPSFVPETRQHVQQTSLNQTVRTSRSSDSGCSHTPSKAKAVGLENWRAPTVFAPHWTVCFLPVLH